MIHRQSFGLGGGPDPVVMEPFLASRNFNPEQWDGGKLTREILVLRDRFADLNVDSLLNDDIGKIRGIDFSLDEG